MPSPFLWSSPEFIHQSKGNKQNQRGKSENGGGGKNQLISSSVLAGGAIMQAHLQKQRHRYKTYRTENFLKLKENACHKECQDNHPVSISLRLFWAEILSAAGNFRVTKMLTYPWFPRQEPNVFFLPCGFCIIAENKRLWYLHTLFSEIIITIERHRLWLLRHKRNRQKYKVHHLYPMLYALHYRLVNRHIRKSEF